ncbi:MULTISPECIES: pyruvate formate-lyase-activating protein [Bacillaceae]|jgi:pyruvate formate lyase activating enzyme|uniref:Pyruvate formate-lyase-activating enzyme n=2 Tax=Bacillaceae TaxID=186817 RepID=A0A090IW30_9BACI|nr:MULTISPECIES: pyruvate formate-lyase-activating protein [Bacillaceae]AWI11466.1 pyruvate formate-lyase 1-activating enzyme [Caldibacillus thermoamylovorans]KIO67155.1 Pyruvate formate-lyase activating enzyme [Caldibacillus thermoamylovorans]KIO69969.1 Pyruvate formate-lyase activating enzyme [Caldibacillus thermoamylovorans]KIO71099.1 Pyruvate formate-lyase activating enzyme [Caldibacillus thermoamylovorans]MCM3478685.1 pyruvate formate-lyase-activating protein [Caldibacillus thermoamylovor
MVTGRIHSVESFGAVDGPGLRYVVFTQGCLLRCQYCHNADTWKIGNGKEMTVQEIMDDVLSYLPFFEASGGGITVSGGEPLLQMDFLIELFKECKKHGIHTTIDSSGGPFNRRPNFMEKLDELLQYTDLILLDLKHIDSEKHKFITGMTNEHILDFAQYLSEKNIPVWIRHVLVPTLSDFDEDLLRLADFIKTLNNVEKIEVLPYHKLGVYKWESLGLEYKLKDVEPPSQERVENAKRILNAALAHA